ncbi:hypothetical protein GN244_ATG04322 [Phytophthora infestans]|uniref:Secreted RxLR effector peptide protein n=1 Tax=Phytophthora infestans TaxID=4787 RepID=A0A833T6L0_PHYIN|nr:hypothetical protein GN244_ATG04322 [Phytophthora infestans]KAF4146001.1 hypothetical protein GN958_ATG04824 [Phytophthora infestans]
MRTSFGIAFTLIATSFFCVHGAIATGGLRGANDVGSEERKLDQLDGSGSASSIVWVNGSKAEPEKRKYVDYHHGHQQKVCQINCPKNCWYVDVFDN